MGTRVYSMMERMVWDNERRFKRSLLCKYENEEAARRSNGLLLLCKEEFSNGSSQGAAPQ
jgi:hypothetical protein